MWKNVPTKKMACTSYCTCPMPWKIMIRTINTDVVPAVSKMTDIDADEVWTAFSAGKHFRYLAIHEIAAQLCPPKAQAFYVLHALTGCDTASLFSGRGKRTTWNAWNVFDQITDVLADLSSIPESIPEEYMRPIERFVIPLYSKTTRGMTENKTFYQQKKHGRVLLFTVLTF